MRNNQRNHWESCLLGLLLLFTASGGMPLSKEDNSWQHCKNASQNIIQKLRHLGIKLPVEASWTQQISFPQRIECSDSCDPDSLNGDKMPCLQKIRKELQHYHDFLSWISEFKSDSKPNITDLRSAVYDLLNLLKPLPQNERKTPELDRRNFSTWEFEHLRDETLWRLQSFSVVVARVFAHCAALTMNTNHKG